MSKIRPFCCGTQYADWLDRNCFQCAKGFDYEKSEYRCELQKALDEACAGDGTITEDIAVEIGYQKGLYTWQCKQFVKGGNHEV